MKETLESRIDLIFSMSINESKEEVKEKFIKYCEDYDDLEREPTIYEKIRHREMFEKFAGYMIREDVR